MSVPTAPLIVDHPVCLLTSIRFWWLPPSSGAPLIKYTLACTAISYSQDLSDDVTNYDVTGLTPGTSYLFTITATNASGTGPAAPFPLVAAGAPPPAPSTVSVTSLDLTTASISWIPGTVPNQAPLRAYLIWALPTSGAASTFYQTYYPQVSSVNFGGLSTNTTYQFRVHGFADPGYSMPGMLTSSISFSPFLNGLRYAVYSGYFSDNTTYFDGRASTSAGVASTFTNINTGTAGALNVGGSENISVQWLGFFRPQVTGSHTFFTVSDDASYLWIGSNAESGYTSNNALVNNGGLHAMLERSGSISLTAGINYPMRVQFGELSGGDDINISVTPPGGSRIYNLGGYVFYN